MPEFQKWHEEMITGMLWLYQCASDMLRVGHAYTHIRVSMVSQEAEEYRGCAGMAKAPGDEAAVDECRVAYRIRVRQWLHLNPDDDDAAPPTKKVFRGQTREWLLCSDKCLRVLTNKGWEHYQLPANKIDRTKDPYEWECVMVAIDQGDIIRIM